MKYLQIFLLISILFGLSSCWKDTKNTQTIDYNSLGEIQTVWSQQSELQENLKQEKTITSSQNELFEISEIFQTHAEKYNQTIIDILQKYKNNFTQSDIENIKLLVSKNYSNEVLQQKLATLLETEVLESDVQKLKDSYHTFIDERDVQTQRLKIQQDEQTMMAITQRDTIITTLIDDIIASRDDWTEQETQSIMQEIITYFYQNSNISDIESFTDIIQTLEETYNVVVNTKNIMNSTYDFDQLSFLDFMQNLTQNYETTLSYNELIEYYNTYVSHELLLENITTEISLVESDTPLTQYETILEENTTQIESLYETHEVFTTLTIEEIESYFTSELDYGEIEILHQERIQEMGELPDAVTQSLQQEYKDDSAMIENLTPIAYVQELVGHNILITNLAGGSKLAQENDLLYAGYAVESFGDSQTVLVFSDESLLRMEENSKLILTQSADTNLGVNIEYGNIWSRVIKPLFTQDSFEISSDSVSLAVRGTSIYIQKDRNSNSISISVVDSYTAKGTSSVELRDKTTGENLSLGKGEVFTKNDANISGQKNTFSKSSLMQQYTKVSQYLQDDLQYLSLTLDDRNRGFYNNPISSKNDSKNFIDKISGELESSLPTTEELDIFFQNDQTPKNNITSDTIYLRIMQDKLITDIKNESENNTPSKISAVASLELENLKRDIGNLREIENRLDLNISDTIISKPSLNPQEITDTFLDFGLEQEQANKNKLIRVKKHLQDTINNGSAYVTGNLELPKEYEGVSINWISNNSEYLDDFGNILKYSTQKDIILSLTANMSIDAQNLSHVFPLIIKKKKPTDMQQLEKSFNILKEYINNIDIYTDTILLPDFNEQGAIIPKIVWDEDSVVLSNGGLIRPSYAQGDIVNYTATATLEFGEAVLEDKDFLLKRIKKQAEIPEEIQQEFNVQSADTKFPGCNINDIQLSNGQVWAMCNAGSQKSGLGTDSYGGYYKYKGGNAADACNIPGYTLPTKDDFESLLDYFGSVENTISALQLPKAGGKFTEYGLSYDNIGIGANISYWSKTYDYDDRYFYLDGTGILSYYRKSKFSVRCIKTDDGGAPVVENPEVVIEIVEEADDLLEEVEQEVIEVVDISEVANELLSSEKDRLTPYFENPITIENDVINIADILPSLNPEITYTWSRALTYVGENGTVFSPSYNQGDTNKTLKLTLTHEDTPANRVVNDIEITLERDNCDGEIIGEMCYELVASAEYNSAGSYNLMNGATTKVIANIGSGVNSNDLNLENSSRGITQLNRYKSHVQVGGQKGIYLDNYADDDHLSYNLSSLNLGDDWAIEMSVRGEDLKRSGNNTYYLFASPGNFAINSKYKKIRMLSKGDSIKEYNTSGYSNTYYNVIFTNKELYINGNKKYSYNPISLSSQIKIGGSRDNWDQWNGIINSFKIFKKK